MKNLIRRILREGWEDTGWETDTKKITIQDVLDYLDNDEVYNLSVKTILDTIGDKFTIVKTDSDRILKADLNHPIIIVKKNGQLSYILDGNHRMKKAIEVGEDTIKVKILDLDKPNIPPTFKELF
jgi:intein/homing endonuclease